MKHVRLALAAILLCFPIFAQSRLRVVYIDVNSPVPNGCSPIYNTTTRLFTCSVISGGGGSMTWGSITGTLSAQTDLNAALGLKAPLAGPTFTGLVTIPTPSTGDNSTAAASTAFVKAQNYLTGNQTITISGDASGSGTTAITLTFPTVNGNVGSFGSSTLIPVITVNAKGQVTGISTVAAAGGGGGGTWGSISGTLSSQTDLQTALNLKANLAGPTFTGSVTIPTPSTGDNSTLAASTAFVKSQNYLTANQTITVTGDGTASGTTSLALTLANSGASAGSYGSSTLIPVVTVNAKGLITGITTVSASGGGGPTLTTDHLDLQVVRTSATVLTIGAGCTVGAPCRVRQGSTTYNVTASATATITAGTGTAYIYFDGGTIFVDHNLTVTCSGCTQQAGTSFPVDSIPLSQATAVSTVWDTPVNDSRAFFKSGFRIIPGAGLTKSVSGRDLTLSFDTTSGFFPSAGCSNVTTDKLIWDSGIQRLVCATDQTGSGSVLGAANLTTVGAIPYVSASGTLQQDATQFFWDFTNNRLGIGNAAPTEALDVTGNLKVSGAITAGSATAMLITGLHGTAPSSPAANNYSFYVDSGDTHYKVKNSAGTVFDFQWIAGLTGIVRGGGTAAELSGDATTSGSNAVTVLKVNAVAFPAAPSTNTVAVITASNTATYKALPNCTDTGGNHLNYDTSTSAFSCGTSGGGGSGIASLGFAGSPQTGSTQTFAFDSSGTDFAIASASNVHTFSLPSASATARGLVTTGAQTIAGVKTLTDQLVNSANGAASTPAVFITGTPYAAGTATTNKALVLIETAGATSTGWGTASTMFGVNAAASYTGNLFDFQVNGTSALKMNANTITFQNGGTTMAITPATITSGGLPLDIRSSATLTTAGYAVRFIRSGGNVTNTTGDSGAAQTFVTFAPASGTGTFNGFLINDTYSQTSTATGITRGIHISPTTTSVYDLRLLEVAAKTITVLSGSPDQTSVVLNGHTYAAGATKTLTNASTFDIVAAPAPGMNMTITNAYAMRVLSGLARFAGNVQLVAVALSSLGTCTSALSGVTAYVNDATAPTYNATLTGGGSVLTLAVCNGSNWTAH